LGLTYIHGSSIIKDREQIKAEIEVVYGYTDIIAYLAQNSGYLTIKNMAGHFDVSERTIRYDLDVIENYLKENKLIKKPKLGVKLDCSAEEKELLMRMIQSLDCKVLSPGERVYLIIIYLICADPGITIERWRKSFM